MAKKISQLTQATQVKSDDVTVIVQDGETKKLPLNMMVTKQDIENKKVAGLAKLDEIEATYENDTYTPTIAVKNKSSVKVGEGDGVDYSANVMDGPAKSAILKGQTLVNVYKITASTPYTYKAGSNPSSKLIVNLSANKTYLIILDFSTVDKDGKEKLEFFPMSTFIDETKKQESNFSIDKNGRFTYKYTPSKDVKNYTIIIGQNNFESNNPTVVLENAMIIEYQQGMENWNIPYFEGMQSVKMPVLTTFSYTNLINENDNTFLTPYLYPNKLFYKSTNNTHHTLHYYNADKVKIGDSGSEWSSKTQYQPPYGTVFVRMEYTADTHSPMLGYNNEETYKPFTPIKSNILTTLEEVELRRIGEVQDTLDCLTGEVTQRVNEVVLSENNVKQGGWNNETHMSFDVIVDNGTKITNKVTTTSNVFKCVIRNLYGGTSTEEFVTNTASGNIAIMIRKDRLETANKEGFVKWLQTNPVIIQYQLATESIKTVDLMPSGTHPSTTPYCWKNGHIQLSSSGLLPNLEYSVVTSRAGQINQNATMIVKNDKRIFDLEILLAGGLVNTTYQALTLQNQVETGLSKVSLNSETEPDYLLYHMIMKLIEEKAYKLDDLTEKVSVFYLYEKLSDEQFETIYAALYPFAEDEYFESDIPGDDEVIEEPIVDESLEEVEDEVVM